METPVIQDAQILAKIVVRIYVDLIVKQHVNLGVDLTVVEIVIKRVALLVL